MNDTRLSIRLPATTKAKLRDLSSAKRVSESEFARLLITRVLNQRDSELLGREIGDPDTTRVRLEVRLTESALQGVAKLAAESGMSTNRWVVALIHAYLTRAPQFGAQELTVVADSTRALAAIGRNLNQVAHALNRGDQGQDLVPVLKALRVQISDHIQHVSRLIQANVNRWRITWQ